VADAEEFGELDEASRPNHSSANNPLLSIANMHRRSVCRPKPWLRDQVTMYVPGSSRPRRVFPPKVRNESGNITW
jgi:hypothetical protein